MPIRVIDEILPNGRTFPVADVNNIRGGVHYAETNADMYAIHDSRLVDGTQCYVKEEKRFYLYDAEKKVWNLSTLGSEMKYQCTVDIIDGAEMTTGTIGNLPPMSRDALEKLSVNDIFTRALFAEQPPYIKHSPGSVPTFATISAEVGTIPSKDAFTSTGIQTEIGFTLDKFNKVVKTVYSASEVSAHRSVKTTPVVWGFNPAYIQGKCQYTPNIPSNIDSLMRTSWGRTTADYKTDNKNWTAPNTSSLVKGSNLGNMSGSVNGYYVTYYKPGTVDEPTTLYDDYNRNASYIINQSMAQLRQLPNITTAGSIQIGTDTKFGLPNSAYVYIMLPNTLKITAASMKNGLTGAYDALSTKNFGKVADQIKADGYNAIPVTQTSRVVSGKTLYTYNIWFVAKGDRNAKNQVSCSAAPLKITIAKV